MTDVAPTAAPEKVCPRCGRTYGADSVFCAADGSSLRPLATGQELVGSVIADRYLVLDKLGEGGMGRVYRARHVRLPQEVAIKVLSPRLVDDPEAIARFNREAANASQISNEHVARVFDFGETGDGLVYLAMEFVPGRTLRGVLDAEGPLQPHRAASLVWQIADGLDAAHRRGIVHRDLKPENVIVYVDTDGSECLKVVDFGIAKALADGPGGGGRMTRTGLVIGTPEYMSPEQITGDAVDARSDVYALALVTAVLLTGRVPFEANTPEQAMTARLLHPPRPLGTLRPEVAWPPELQAVLDRGLARDPGARYATAGEFADALVGATDLWIAPDDPPGTGPTARLTAPGRRPTPARPSTVVPPRAALEPTEPYARAAAPTADAPPPAASAALSATDVARAPAVAAPPPTGPVAPPPAPAAAPAPTAQPAPGAAPRRSGARFGVLVGGVVAAAIAAAVAINAIRGAGGDDEAPLVAADSARVTAPVPAPDTQATGADAGVPPRSDTAAPPGAPPVPAPPGSSPGPAAPAAALGRAEAARLLGGLEGALDPTTVTAARAERALRELDELLPRLAHPDDRFRADMLRSEALASAGQEPRACTLLREVERRTLTQTQRGAVELNLQAFGCPAR